MIRKKTVVVAGQIPPPLGGQNIAIRRMIEIFRSEPDIDVRHLPFHFTKDWSGARQLGFSKISELARVVFRFVFLALSGRSDHLIYPVGGPHSVAVLRDIILLPFARLSSRRVSLHFHAAGISDWLNHCSWWIRCLATLFYKSFGSDAIVITEFGRIDALALGLQKISVVPNATEDVAGGKLHRPISDNSVTLLNVGHLCKDKGTPDLLAAFAELAKNYRNLHLLLVGDPLTPYSSDQLLSDIKATGVEDRISWNGSLQGEQLEEAFRKADIFVFSSVAPYESFGLVMIEAMHWSLPLVITDWRANQTVATKEFGGVLAENPTEDLRRALYLAILEALDNQNLWVAWGARNRLIFEENYTLSSLRSKLRDLLDAG